MSYTPTKVFTIDGREVLSDSPEWRQCCEAVHMLNQSMDRRVTLLELIGKRRGEAGMRELKAEMSRLEPAYMLAMANKDARREYLESVMKHRGKFEHDRLKDALVALWEQRKAAQASAA